MPVNIDLLALFSFPAPTFWETNDAIDCMRARGINIAKFTTLFQYFNYKNRKIPFANNAEGIIIQPFIYSSASFEAFFPVIMATTASTALIRHHPDQIAKSE